MDYPGTNRPQRRYRLNGKKMAATLVMLVFIAAVAVVAVLALKRGADAEVVSVGNIAEPQGNQLSVVTITDAPETAAAANETSATVSKTPIVAPTSGQTTAPAQGTLASRVIVVDAGHGGFDPGAVGVTGVHESDINLAVAQFLKTELESRSAQVIMTREEDVGLGTTQNESLQERRRIIEQSGSDIVISIHMNNYKEDPDVSGPLALFMPGSEKGKALAESIQTCLNTALDAAGSARSENLYVLKSGNQPCVLVECGYLSNEDEERRLQQSEYQKKVAKAICDGAAAFLSGE